MTNKIGVIGCGWLGLPLAERLIDKGYEVKGTTTSNEKLAVLNEKGIIPFHISISENKIHGSIAQFLESVAILIINIPPKLRGKGPKESYIAKIELLHRAIQKSNVKNLIFVSSTAVYGNAKGIVTEKTAPMPVTASGLQLLQCENLLKNDPTLNTTIIRFGGLIGPKRHPITMLSGRKNLDGAKAPVNLIHLTDCIGIIETLIIKHHFGDILNAVYPDHPTKKEYYTSIALNRNLEPPIYTESKDASHKLIQSCSIFLIKNYDFLAAIN